MKPIRPDASISTTQGSQARTGASGAKSPAQPCDDRLPAAQRLAGGEDGTVVDKGFERHEVLRANRRREGPFGRAKLFDESLDRLACRLGLCGRRSWSPVLRACRGGREQTKKQ